MFNLRKRVKQLTNLTYKEWQILLLSLVTLPIVGLALNIKNYQWTSSKLKRSVASIAPSILPLDIQAEESQIVARMVFIAANHGLYRANCLKKSLVIWWLLARAGIPTDLKIGIRKADEVFAAHSWVEAFGTVLVDHPDVNQTYQPITGISDLQYARFE